MPEQLTNQNTCQITGRDDLPNSEMKDLDGIGRVSKLAYRLWRLGNRLTKFDCIVRVPSPKDDFENGTLLFPTHQSQSGNYQYAEYKVGLSSQIGRYDARWLVNNWNLACYRDNKTFPFLFGKYVRSAADLPDDARDVEKEEYLLDHYGEMDNPEDVTASFSELAKAAQGSRSHWLSPN